MTDDMITESQLNVMAVVARAGSVDLAAPILRAQFGLEEGSPGLRAAVDLATIAMGKIIETAPSSLTPQKACALFNMRLLLNDALSGEHPSSSMALDIQKEINKLLADT